ncbi:MAG: PDZ domain-containing protein [Pseudomonadota bacterium]
MHVAYRIGAARAEAHLFDVSITVSGNEQDTLVLRLPAWIPGSYLVRDYARHVVNIDASDASGHALMIERPDKSSWRLLGTGRDVHVHMRVYGWDLSVRGAHLDNTHAYFNGACVFPEVIGVQTPLSLTIERPHGLPDDAVVATSMPVVDCDPAGFGRYRCADYDELIDHPVEIAVQQCVSFEAAGVAHRFFVRGADAFDHDRLAHDCQKICEEHHALMGTPDDLNAYTFMAYALDSGYGGLEHRWSTSLAISRSDLPRVGAPTDEAAYRKCLGLISHEYFHLWNVRRLKPEVFTPLDMTQEVHTGLLWVFEGITSYFDDLALVRSGVIDEPAYFALLGENLTRVMRTRGRLHQSLELSSVDAWTRFYKQDENATNAIVSYYAKGALAALALDLTLRADSETTLDAVMREAWTRYYVNGGGLPERGLEALAVELSGLALGDFFDQLIRGTNDIDLAPLFAPFGMVCAIRASAPGTDPGGAPAAQAVTAYAGWRFDSKQAGRIAAIVNDTPAETAGLSAGDTLIAVNERRVSATAAERLVAQSRPGDTLRVAVFRRDELKLATLELTAPPQDTVWLAPDPNADATSKARCRAWLASLQTS